VNVKDKFLKFRISKSERDLINALCSQEDLKVSELMREIIREVARQRGMLPAGLILKEDNHKNAGGNSNDII
jgi:antitoxin component of RelBE/YafQ-DinJ toxin-antitoxin module